MRSCCDVSLDCEQSIQMICNYLFFSIDLKVLSIEIVDILQTILPNEQEVGLEQ